MRRVGRSAVLLSSRLFSREFSVVIVFVDGDRWCRLAPRCSFSDLKWAVTPVFPIILFWCWSPMWYGLAVVVFSLGMEHPAVVILLRRHLLLSSLAWFNLLLCLCVVAYCVFCGVLASCNLLLYLCRGVLCVLWCVGVL